MKWFLALLLLMTPSECLDVPVIPCWHHLVVQSWILNPHDVSFLVTLPITKAISALSHGHIASTYHAM